MFLKIIILLVLTANLTQSINLVYFNHIPVDSLVLFKTMLSLQSLQKDLDKNFDKSSFKNTNTYTRTLLTESYLNEINKQITPINNLIIGENNQNTGNANFIIGDANNVAGDQNWVFTQGFNGEANKDLVLDHWQVQLDKSVKILSKPKQAIHKW